MEGKGRIIVDLPPMEGNPRNSEGAFIDRKDGSLLHVYTRFKGSSTSDHALAELAAMYSCDHGDTFSEPVVILTATQHDAMNIMSVSLLRMGNGDIGLFYLVRKDWDDMRFVLCRSSNEGQTWSEPIYCIDRKSLFVINNDRVVKLATGRIIISVAYHYVRHIGDEVTYYGPAITYFYYSDDDGITWSESPSFLALNTPHSFSGLQEPGIVELGGGILWGWARTDMGRQYEFFSRDNGLTWNEPRPSRFTSPLSPMSMKRIPKTNQLIAIWNPIPNYDTREYEYHTSGRTRLVYALSGDNGATWSKSVILENNEFAGYCYVAIHFIEDAMLLSYCAGDTRIDKTCLSKVRIRKISYNEIEGLLIQADGSNYE